MSDRCPEAQEPGEDHVSQGGCCNGQQHGAQQLLVSQPGKTPVATTLHYFLSRSSRESSHDVEMQAEPGRVRRVERRGKLRGDRKASASTAGHNMSV